MLDALLDDPARQKFLHCALHDTDLRIRQGHSASPAFMLASLLWFDMREELRKNRTRGLPEQSALFEAMDTALERQRRALAFPRRLDGMIKEIWSLQSRFEQRAGARPFRLLSHPRLSAAYDFLMIRAESGDASQELADWWGRFQDAGEAERAEMLLPAQSTDTQRRRRKRRKPSNASPAEGD